MEDRKLKCRLEGEDLVAIIPVQETYGLPDFFNVTVKTAEIETIVRCWWIDTECIYEFRTKENEQNQFRNFTLESDDDKFIQDRRNVIEAEMACLPDINAANKATALFAREPSVEDDEENDENYFVDYEIPEEYDPSYKKQREIQAVRQLFINRVFGYYRPVLNSNKESASKQIDNSEEPDPVNNKKDTGIIYREPTSEEESFERFIRRKLKILLDPKNENINNISIIHLFGLIQEYLDIFDKYKNVELFDPFYVAEKRVELFELLLGKDFTKESDQTKYVILLECYKALLNNYYLEIGVREIVYREDYNYTNKQLLDVMANRYNIRTAYKDHINDLFKSEEKVLREDNKDDFSKYIEKLFGYKDQDSLIEFITSRYMCRDIIIKDGMCEIYAQSENKRNHFAPDTEVLKEIRNYSRNVEKINTVKIVVEIINDSYVKSIENTFEIMTSRCRMVTYYNNGNVIEDPERIITI